MAICDEAVRAYLRASGELASGTPVRDYASAAACEPGRASKPGADAAAERAPGEPDGSPDSGFG